MNKHTWSAILNLIGAGFAIFTPIAAIWIKYGALFEERQGFAFVTSGIFVAIGLGLLWIMHWLKGLAETGRPMERTVAREIRFLIPLLLLLAVLSVIYLDIGGIVTVLGLSVVGNVIAVPLRLVGYRLGKRYQHDMASINTLSAVQQMAEDARIYREKQNKKPKPKVKTTPVK